MAIRLTCSCGKTLKVDDKYRGKKIKCPACGERLVVEEGDDTGVQADEPRKRPVKVASERDDDDDDDDEEEERRPRKKKVAQRSMLPWILGGCGVLMLMTCCMVSAGVGVWYFWFRGPADDLIYVHDGVAGFVSFRFGDIWKSQTVQDQLKKLPPQAKADMDRQLAEMEAKAGMKPEDMERFTVIFRSFDNAPIDVDFVVTMKTARPMDRKKILDAMTKDKGLNVKDVKDGGVTIHVVEGGGPNAAMAFHFPSDRVLVVAQKEATIKDVLKQARKSPKSAALTRGVQMASSGRHQLVAAFEISSNLMNKVPPEAWKQAPNLRDMNGFIFAGTLTKDLALELVLTFPNSAKAESAKKDVEELKGVANQAVKMMGPKVPGTVSRFMDSIKIDQRSAEVVASGKLDIDLDGLGPINPLFGGFGGGGGGGIAGAAQRTQSTNNLKQIGLGMHSFHDVQRRLPNYAILHPKTGQPLLSWRVAILPYINEGALYNQIRRDEPWDSQHNRQFWNRMPQVYQLPGKPNDGRTYYQVFRSMPGSLDSVFPQRQPPQPPFGEGGPKTLQAITDGTSNTIMVVESAGSVNWMQPDDILFVSGPAGFPATRLGNHWGDNAFLAGMGDGSVRRFQRTISGADMQALITASGGEVINWGRVEAP